MAFHGPSASACVRRWEQRPPPWGQASAAGQAVLWCHLWLEEGGPGPQVLFFPSGPHFASPPQQVGSAGGAQGCPSPLAGAGGTGPAVTQTHPPPGRSQLCLLQTPFSPTKRHGTPQGSLSAPPPPPHPRPMLMWGPGAVGHRPGPGRG